MIIQKAAYTNIFQSVSTIPAPAPVLRDSAVEGTRHRLKNEYISYHESYTGTPVSSNFFLLFPEKNVLPSHFS